MTKRTKIQLAALLLAAESVHLAMTVDPWAKRKGLKAAQFGCHALKWNQALSGLEDGEYINLVNELFSVFWEGSESQKNGWGVGEFSVLWLTEDAESRILGLLLLRHIILNDSK